MQIGYAARDMTPSPGLTLSGFAARCNRPSTGVDDPIEAHALAIEAEQNLTLLLVFDLLGLGQELNNRLRHTVLDAVRACGWGQPRLILCCTHTHSAPATIRLLGCGISNASFWAHLEKAAVQAAVDALSNLQPAVGSYSANQLTGVSYNRRKILVDGRVVMSPKPDQPVLRSGPTWDRALLVRFDAPGGTPIAGVVCWAAHPCVVCTSSISADYPGELRRSLANAFGFPFLFLQGPSGNVNLPFQEMSRTEMLNNVRRITPQLCRAAWSSPAASWPVQHAGRHVSLAYASRLPTSDLQAIRHGMTQISETGEGPESTMCLLADILNIDPGCQPDPMLVRHIAGAIGQWSSEMLNQEAANCTACELSVDVLRLGPLWFSFVAAELFAETGLALQNRFPNHIVTPVGYASPLVGYLPTDEALAEGGYEVEYAYRFYGHPAPFARGSEPDVRKEIEEMIRSLEGERA